MKWISRLFYVIGFILEYVVPICLFGVVTPLIHGKLEEGLTTVGALAVVILAFIIIGKIKDIVKEWKKSLGRAIILALLKAVPLVAFALVVHFLAPFIAKLQEYIWRIVPIFSVGLIFDVVGEYLDTKEA